MIRTVDWEEGRVVLLDQLRLPAEEVDVVCERPEEVADAIRAMKVRGAPAIGVTAALGLALAVQRHDEQRDGPLHEYFDRQVEVMAGTRPTAVNLTWAVDEMKRAFDEVRGSGAEAIRERMLERALSIRDDDRARCKAMGDHGAGLFGEGSRIITHCNTGSLATAGTGTALAVVRAAAAKGRVSRVYVDETRPYLQGSRLTAWELGKDGIPYTLICDNMSGFLMSRGEADLAIVGADRIAANGDVANKIGTYALAVLCRHHGLPFYVAAPLSTVDCSIPDGSHIPIEERPPRELTHIQGVPLAPEDATVWNPAFDVTPHDLITAIITDAGVLRPPYDTAIRDILSRHSTNV